MLIVGVISPKTFNRGRASVTENVSPASGTLVQHRISTKHKMHDSQVSFTLLDLTHH
jgi:hypothetical protein